MTLLLRAAHSPRSQNYRNGVDYLEGTETASLVTSGRRRRPSAVDPPHSRLPRYAVTAPQPPPRLLYLHLQELKAIVEELNKKKKLAQRDAQSKATNQALSLFENTAARIATDSSSKFASISASLCVVFWSLCRAR